MLSLVGGGAVEVGTIVPSFFPTRIPLAGITNAIPLSFNSGKQAQIIQSELVEKNPEIQEEFRKNNVFPVFNHGIPVFRLLCTKPVATMDDFKVLRVRSYGEYVPHLWRMVGAVGITKLPPEQYEGLQRKNIDCAYFTTDLMQNFKLFEVGKFWSSANFGALATQPTLVNLNVWNKFPDHVKKLFIDVGRDAVAREHEIVDGIEQEALAAMQKAGVQVVKFQHQEQLDKIGPVLQQQWIDNMQSKGMGEPAKRLVDYWRKRRSELK